jgi:hypothetical protein
MVDTVNWKQNNEEDYNERQVSQFYNPFDFIEEEEIVRLSLNSVFKHGSNDLKLNFIDMMVACWKYCIEFRADSDFIDKQLVSENIYSFLIENSNLNCPNRLIRSSLEAIYFILLDEERNTGKNQYNRRAEEFQTMGGTDELEQLNNHPNSQILSQVEKIFKRFYGLCQFEELRK